MNKADLVAKVAQMSGNTKKTVEDVMAALVSVVTTTVSSGEEVKITGLGTFRLVNRAARTGINPQTKQPMKIAASKAPAFKISATLKNAVSGKK